MRQTDVTIIKEQKSIKNIITVLSSLDFLNFLQNSKLKTWQLL